MKLVIIGLPGSGKGSQAVLLEKNFGWKHLSTGDICRNISKQDTVLGYKVRQLLNEGKLISDKIMNEVLVEVLPKDDYILDGYPRNLSQAVFLDSLNAPDAAFLLDVKYNILLNRLLEKRKREDDTEEIIENRIKEYAINTLPVVDFYSNKGKLIILDANGSIEEVDKEITKKLIEKFNIGG